MAGTNRSTRDPSGPDELDELLLAMEAEFGPGWRLGQPAGKSAVAAFEASHGIELPEPYGSFVATVTNGALGPPHYGLVPLGEPASRGIGHAVVPGAVRRPFPLTQPWVWVGSEDLSDNGVMARIQAVHEAGILPLGTDGDGMDDVLIISGPARTEVWLVTGEGALPVAHDFERWILRDYLPDAHWLLKNRPPYAASKPLGD